MSSDAALSQLAEHALSPAVEVPAIGPVASERLALCLLDLFGCHLAARAMGANLAIERIAVQEARHFKRVASAHLWGSAATASPFAASLANGTIAHHAEFDAGWHGPPGVGANAAVTVLPAALAVAESVRASGLQFIAAVAAGYDTLAALARALCASAVGYRLHPPGLLGAFGAAAASARLWQLPQETLFDALGAVGGIAPLCPFESFTAGASAKDLYGGWPAAVGVAAAAAAAAGERTLDRAPFALPALLRREPIGPDEVLASLRRPALLDADFKAFPTCRSVQPALSALEKLIAATPVDAADVGSIAVETYRYAVDLDLAADPAWPIGARTSIPMCIALRLCKPGLEPADFAEGRLHDPAVRALASRVSVELGRFASRPGRGAALTVTLRDGRRLASEVAAERWNSDRPATANEIVEKFRGLASPMLAATDVERLIERTLDLAHCPDVRELTAILARSAPLPRAQRDTDRVASPACPQARATGERARRRLGRAFTACGLDARPLDGVLDMTLRAARELHLTPADETRAITLALALAPCGAGSLPEGWIATQGCLMARLAQRGFGGPPGVFDGVRGLRWLAGD